MTLVAQLALGSWLVACGAYVIGRKRPWIGDALAMLGVLAGALFLASLWVTLDRPPMRTLGETRWWYAVLVPLIGVLIGWRFQTRALAIPSCLMGALFAGFNLARPDLMDRTLVPALQSPWFVPHVVVYMVAYAALGLSGLIGAYMLVRAWWKKTPLQPHDVDPAHRLVLVGFPLLTCGLLFGAIWAKEAWGHYWTWDPKETWAFLTWAAYLVYIHVHVRHRTAMRPALNLWLLVVGFTVMMITWFGVNYLPTAKESVHTYTQG